MLLAVPGTQVGCFSGLGGIGQPRPRALGSFSQSGVEPSLLGLHSRPKARGEARARRWLSHGTGHCPQGGTLPWTPPRSPPWKAVPWASQQTLAAQVAGAEVSLGSFQACSWEKLASGYGLRGTKVLESWMSKLQMVAQARDRQKPSEGGFAARDPQQGHEE